MLEVIADDTWVVAVPHSMFGLRIGTRMTIVRLSSGDLWLHSPVKRSADIAAAVDALGPVRYIVAPNAFHHLFAGEWQSAYPKAQLHAPAALGKKRRDLRLDATLEEASKAEWSKELVPLHMDGCLLDETVFVHPKAKVAISSDLTENFVTSPHLPTRLYLKASGIYGRVGWSRFLRVLYRDRVAAKRSLERVLAHDFDRLVIAHGELISRDAKAALAESFAFLG